MSSPARAAGAEQGQSRRDSQSRKHRASSHGLSSVSPSIADAIVLKQGDLFLIANPDGQVPGTGTHGLGLYYHDCRFLRTYELRLNGESLVCLGATVSSGDRGAVQLTNPEMETEGAGKIPRDTLDIEWSRAIDASSNALVDGLRLRNWGHQPFECELDLRFDAGFEDVFEVRGLIHEPLGTMDPPTWDDGLLRFLYHGKDGLARSLTVCLPPEFARADASSARATIRVDARQEHRLPIHLLVRESADQNEVRSARPVDDGRPVPEPRSEPDGEAGGATFASDSQSLVRALERGLADLRLLRSTLRGRTFIAAGIPWYATLFGRDSLIAALQVLPFAPEIARDTLYLLAGFQAERVDQWKDAEPGKVLHELRVGELAHIDAIPHSPYYGSVDATPLFLIVVAEYVAWTGDLALFGELGDHVHRALDWIDHYGDSDGDGYVEYRSTSQHGLVNQGWKDSGDGIIDEHGRIATPPIAMVEVQAYVYAAKLGVASLFARRGDHATAERLQREADALRDRFDRDFWVESLGCYAMALEARKQPLRVVSSNAGQALWCGIASPAHAARVAEHLMADDMFSGWGVRTLSQDCEGYNPIGYHLGTVWPHDNAFIGAGLKRYGFAAEASRIFDGILAAASEFDHNRLPELWTGFSRARYGTPIRYPIACHPQAWAAGSLPFLLRHLLGVEPGALDGRLHIRQPTLPRGLDWLEVRGVRVGTASVDLRLDRPASGGDQARVDVARVRGKLDVRVDYGGDSAQEGGV
ncbi:MAG TPA: glycogen debranching N-terminal domain-containing protein [Gemmatimonadales bacterium]|nr:glycogen debranching N-terminal domain-containing protein [Gemmatimonadales bacterium]